MTLLVASQRVFIVNVVCFIIDSVRKLLDTPSYVNSAFFCILPDSSICDISSDATCDYFLPHHRGIIQYVPIYTH
jgi:hypothetical protein